MLGCNLWVRTERVAKQTKRTQLHSIRSRKSRIECKTRETKPTIGSLGKIFRLDLQLEGYFESVQGEDMPARDRYHDRVKNALIKNGWTITDDPLHIKWGKKDRYVDLGAEQLLAAEKGKRKIAVEVKGFLGHSRDGRPRASHRSIYDPWRGSLPRRTRSHFAFGGQPGGVQ